MKQISKSHSYEKYRKKYLNFIYSISKTRITTIVSRAILKNFPKGLSPELAKQIRADMWGDSRKSSVEIKGGETLDQDLAELNLAVAGLLLTRPSKPEKTKAKPTFGRPLWSQEIVMLIALLDAFIADSVRTICEVQPKVMKL